MPTWEHGLEEIRNITATPFTAASNTWVIRDGKFGRSQIDLYQLNTHDSIIIANPGLDEAEIAVIDNKSDRSPYTKFRELISGC